MGGAIRVESDAGRGSKFSVELAFPRAESATSAGPVELLGFGNADETNTDSSRDATHPAFRGRALAIVRTTDAAGAITIKATAPGLKPASVQLHSQR